jgi:hypothetical protein
MGRARPSNARLRYHSSTTEGTTIFPGQVSPDIRVEKDAVHVLSALSPRTGIERPTSTGLLYLRSYPNKIDRVNFERGHVGQ